MNVDTIELVQKLMSMTLEQRRKYVDSRTYREIREMAYKFYEALTEVIELDEEPDFSIPSWDEVEEILKMESERGIK